MNFYRKYPNELCWMSRRILISTFMSKYVVDGFENTMQMFVKTSVWWQLLLNQIIKTKGKLYNDHVQPFMTQLQATNAFV